MAIISFEEIEQQVVEQESPVETAMDKELLEESVNLKQKELSAIGSLVETIDRQDELISDVEEGKKDLEEVKEELHESMIAAEHFCQVLGNMSIKNVAELKKTSLSFESINRDPVEALKGFNTVLKTLSDNISFEAVEEVQRGKLERLVAYFKTIDKEYKSYSSESNKILNIIKEHKNNLELRPDIELSAVSKILTSEFVVDTGRNFAEFTEKYYKLLKTESKELKLNLKSFGQIKSVEGSDNGASPVGFKLWREKGNDGIKAFTVSPTMIKILNERFKGDKTTRDFDFSFTQVFVEPKSNDNIKSVEDLFKRLSDSNSGMDTHYSFIKKSVDDYMLLGRRILNQMARNFQNFVHHAGQTATAYTGGLGGGAIGAAAGTLVGGRKGAMIGGALGGIVGSIGLGFKSYDAFKYLVPVNKINDELHQIAKSNFIWGDVVAAQRELVGMLKPKDGLDENLKKEIEAKLSLAKK